jgi:hypothetical protein
MLSVALLTAIILSIVILRAALLCVIKLTFILTSYHYADICTSVCHYAECN